MPFSDLAAAFLDAAPSAARQELQGVADLGARLDAGLAAAKTAWPTLGPRRPEEFAAFVGARLPASGAAAAFQILRFGDLLLVFASLAEAPEAIEAVGKVITQQVERESRRLNVADAADEARQLVLQLLLVAQPGTPKALTQYSGRGDLAAWVRVISVRELLRLRTARKKGARSDDSALSDLVAKGDDPELGLLRTQFKAEFRASFAAAVQGLAERDRNLLRQHFVDQLSIDEIAAIYGIHRATAARWVTKAKETVGEATRAEIRQRININTEELDSLLRLVDSRLDVSMRMLKSDQEP